MVCIGDTNILIDCGKTFKSAMLDVFRRHERADHLNAVILTHAHADACLGLDDLREFVPGERNHEIPIDVYVRDIDFAAGLCLLC